MSTTTQTKGQTPTTARRWAAATLIGLVAAIALGALYSWRNPDQPLAVSLLVMSLMTWPVLTVAFQMLWFDRARTDAEFHRAKDDVERSWVQEASATAFATLIGGLICFEYLGAALRLSWLSPIGLPHVLVLGLGTFALSYLWLRRRA